MTDAEPTLDERRDALRRYDLRQVQPHVTFGTASDRYAGWIGQVYPERYRASLSSRKRKLGGKTFEELTLPITSVEDYFEHFGVLEIDFTYYRPLLDEDGTASPNLHVLRQYAEHAPDEARFLLKAPQDVFAPTLRRSSGGRVRYEANPGYLDAEAYLRRFHEPALALLGDRLVGSILEQPYQRVQDSPPPEAFAAELDRFFQQLPPGEVQPHVEVRSEHLLMPVFFDMLAQRGVGYVFSHWTWLPMLREQWQRCGERFTAASGEVVTRLLTPRDVKYAAAYAQAYPFDKPVPQVAGSREAQSMVLDATALAYRVAEEGETLYVIANNRAWGNAPDLARTVARRILREEERRTA